MATGAYDPAKPCSYPRARWFLRDPAYTLFPPGFVACEDVNTGRVNAQCGACVCRQTQRERSPAGAYLDFVTCVSSASSACDGPRMVNCGLSTDGGNNNNSSNTSSSSSRRSAPSTNGSTTLTTTSSGSSAGPAQAQKAAAGATTSLFDAPLVITMVFGAVVVIASIAFILRTIHKTRQAASLSTKTPPCAPTATTMTGAVESAPSYDLCSSTTTSQPCGVLSEGAGGCGSNDSGTGAGAQGHWGRGAGSTISSQSSLVPPFHRGERAKEIVLAHDYRHPDAHPPSSASPPEPAPSSQVTMSITTYRGLSEINLSLDSILTSTTRSYLHPAARADVAATAHNAGDPRRQQSTVVGHCAAGVCPVTGAGTVEEDEDDMFFLETNDSALMLDTTDLVRHQGRLFSPSSTIDDRRASSLFSEDSLGEFDSVRGSHNAAADNDERDKSPRARAPDRASLEF